MSMGNEGKTRIDTPSVRAARKLLLSREFWNRVPDGMQARRKIAALKSTEIMEHAGWIIARETGCNNLKSQFDEANRQILQLHKEEQALSADLARATDTLHKIKQILGNKGDTCKCGVCQAVGLLEGVVWQ